MADPRIAAASYVEVVRQRADEDPERPALSFLSTGGEAEIELTYGEIDRRARALAATLQDLGERGNRALLMLPPGADFATAFLGCLYAGVVAVPVYPPRRKRGLGRALAVIADAQPRWILTTTDSEARLRELFGGRSRELHWVAVDGVDPASGEGFEACAADPRAVAFVQYTSGSTSEPKGVVIHHGNLLHNQRMIQSAFGTSCESTIVGWLPLYHDMGLIGNLLQPLYLGARTVLMSPMSFVQHPERWLQAISRFRGTTSGGPNFAYELCLRRISESQLEDLDLSSWQVAFCGAEPVREDTLENFARKFASAGFHRASFFPCYGLAEATLFVTSSRVGEGAAVLGVNAESLGQGRVVEAPESAGEVRRLVSCGVPHPEQRLAIVDPETARICEADQVGEIWVSGKSVARGYWRREEESAATFGARLADDEEGRFLRTGDLGFLRGGEVYVTGRLKDLIILRGRNHYPQDVELTVERSGADLRPGCGAAFSVEVEGEERLVVVQEVKRRTAENLEQLLEKVRQNIAEEHEVAVHEVLLVRVGGVPKTSSGKVRRRLCCRLYLEDLLPAVARSQQTVMEEERTLTLDPVRLRTLPPPRARRLLEPYLITQAARWARVVSDRVDREAPLRELGLDSVAAARWSQALEADLGVRLPLARLLHAPRVEELATEVLGLLRGDGKKLAPKAWGGEGAEAFASYGQRALWFEGRRAPKRRDLYLSVVGRICGELVPEILQRALGRLVLRHSALRTTFVEREGLPVQKVHRELAPGFRQVFAKDLSVEQLEGLLDEELERPLKVEEGPLLRVVVYTRGHREWLVQWTVHHLVVDFRSMEILARELGVLYAAELNGTRAALSSPKLSYSDYCRWQEAQLAGPEGDRLARYWRNYLREPAAALELPADRLRRPGGKRPGGLRSMWFRETVSAEANRLGRELGCTLFATLLSVWQIVLHRTTGQRDLAVGCPSSGRLEPSFADLVGYFVNPLVLPSRLVRTVRCDEMLRRTGQQVAQALDHQEYPFARLAERLGGERSGVRTPWFQVMFVLQRAGDESEEGISGFALGLAGSRLKLGPLTLESVERAPAEVQFDLTLMVAELEGKIAACLQYDRSLFDATTLDRLLGHFRIALEAVIAAPSCQVGDLNLLTVSEQHQLLREWNDTARAWTEPSTVWDWVVKQARLRPEATALHGGDSWVSYGELVCRSGALALELRRRGVGPEERVGVMARRSDRLVLGLLGILRAGGAYVPLDPDHPGRRLSQVSSEMAFRVMLVEPELVATVTEELGAALPEEKHQVFALEAAMGWPSAPAQHCPRRLTEEQAAYVIYTSGSTGIPKGVVLSDRGLHNVLRSMVGELNLDARDVVFALTTPSFDISVAELLLPLMVGARLELASREDVLDGRKLGQKLAINNATLLQATPSTWQMLLDAGSLPPSDLRAISTGEALPDSLAMRLVPRVGRLWDLYGPSEASIWSTQERVRRSKGSSIGRPIANTEVHVVDASGNSLPVGAVGQLLMGGAGLGRGYFARPGATAEKFVPNPFSGQRGERLYSTGDRVRRLANGSVEYLGRLDHQVKLRGFRIELGEIETALRGHPSVGEAVATVVDEGSAKTAQLTAYVVPSKGATVSTFKLREFLGERVPAYMVPALFVFLEELPLTPNGKLDRKALPPPTQSKGTAGAGLEGPVEEVLATIWAEALGRELQGEGVSIGRDDDFFTLGGHSLLATRVLSRIHRDLEVELSVRDLFDAPTLRQLAERVVTARRPAEGEENPPIQRVSRDQPLPLSFGQHRLWVLEQLDLGGAAYHIPVSLELAGRLDPAILARALAEIVRRHEVLRTGFVASGGHPRQVITEIESPHLPVWDLSALDAGLRDLELPRRLEKFARLAFDLEAGVPLRAALVDLAADRYLLLITVHHLAFDGWSGAIFARELAQIYEAFVAGLPSPLPELSIQYADFAMAQRRREIPEQLLSEWAQRLAGAPPILELPTDRPRPTVLSHRGGRCRRSISPLLSTEIKSLSRSQGVTPFMTLLAIFYLLLERHSGQQDFCVGTPMAHRHRPELEELIGFFVTTLVLRADLGGRLSFSSFLRQVRRTTLEAFDRREFPFELLVERLEPERDLNHHPLFQTFFVFHNEPVPQFTLPHLEIRSQEVYSGFEKFDLTLTLHEEAEGLVATLGYRNELFDASTMGRLLEHFENLLAAVIAAPQGRTDSFQMLGPAAHWQLVGEWSSKEGGAGQDSCIHELFEEWAVRREDAAALVFESAWLSYQELNRRSSRLASALRHLAIGPERPVGVSVEPSLEMIVALLAVLKAGGAYVPLSQQLPLDRQRFMLQDAGAEILLAGRQRGELADFEGAVLSLFGNWDALVPKTVNISQPPATPGNAAYVLYTSGTTGKPKGVLVEHRQVVGYVKGVGERLGMVPGIGHALMQPIAVDSSVTALFGSLLTGGCLHLFSFEHSTDAGRVADYFTKRYVDDLKIAPLHLAALLNAAPGNGALPRRRLICGGEAASSDWMDGLCSSVDAGCEVHNHYGPTEATVGVTTYRVGPRPVQTANAQVPIGRPLNNSAAYVLNQNLDPVPVGVFGQLFLGGRALARGYLGRPAVTAAAFIPDALSASQGARLYRTGDRVRWMVDGNLEFMGRLDRQLKVRGFRIEPGEVEVALVRREMISQAFVTMWRGGPGAPRLVAYVVPEPGAEFCAAELRASLASELPDFMVPSALVTLQELPRTPHGKLDPRALPAPEKRLGEKDVVAPTGLVEERLAKIWKEVLGVEQVSVHDNFFEFGGDSILSIRMVAEAAREGIHLLPRQLFQAQTFAELAEAAEFEAPVEVEQSPVVGMVPLTPIGHWFFEQQLADPHHFNQAILLRVDGGLATVALRRALMAMVAYHDALRLRFVRRGALWQQRNEAFEAAQILGVVDLSGLGKAGGRREMQRVVDGLHASFDLSAGPLLRAALFRLQKSLGNRLLMVAHHLVIDGVSWQILLADLALALEQIGQGRKIHLPPKTTSFKDWAEKLTEYAGSPVAAEEQLFWLAQGKEGPTPLPVDFPGGQNTNSSRRTVTVMLRREETQALLREVPSAYRSQMDEILLAALACAFRSWLDFPSLLVDVESHGREELFEGLNLSRTVGWFTAMFPLRLDLAAAETASGSIHSVKERLRQVPRGGVGYGVLRYLAPKPINDPLCGVPVPPVKFNYLGQLDSALSDSSPFRPAQEASGMARSPRARRSHQFDLLARVSEQRFQLEWGYSNEFHRPQKVQHLAESFLATLREIIDRRQDPDLTITPTDFPLASLSQDDLEGALAEFDFEAD